jgi:hypothetical protein
MLKQDEYWSRLSCFNRAAPYEMVFVLIARDEAAPVAIRAWVDERIRIGKNKRSDDQIVEAEACAAEMERQRAIGVTNLRPSGKNGVE